MGGKSGVTSRVGGGRFDDHRAAPGRWATSTPVGESTTAAGEAHPTLWRCGEREAGVGVVRHAG
jgi:hypothetical protein